MTKLEPSNPMPSSKGSNNQWSQPIHDASATSLNYPPYSSSFPGTSQGVSRPSVPGHNAATSMMTGSGAGTGGMFRTRVVFVRAPAESTSGLNCTQEVDLQSAASTLRNSLWKTLPISIINLMTTLNCAPTLSPSLPPPQGYAQHDPSSHYSSYQQQPYQYYTHQQHQQQQQQQQQPASYPYHYSFSSGGSAMTPSSSSYSSPTHAHTSLSSSPPPASSAGPSLGSMGALLSPKSDFAGQDSHYHINNTNSNQPYPYHHPANALTKESPRNSNSGPGKKSRSQSAASASFPSLSTGASTTSIHAIASATATNIRGGTTAIAANMSPPTSSISSVSAASPPSSVSSPTSPKKKGSQGVKKSPSSSMGMDGLPSKHPKPTQSYSFLITTAILESPNKQLTLNDIYEWVMEHYPWYRTAINGWK
ncbi:Forkhead box protein J2, partial [Gamsiella multidivaricata]